MRVHDASGLRVVARPDALDTAVWRDTENGADPGHGSVFRFAPDEAFGLVGAGGSVDVDDPFAIVVEERGFAVIRLDADEFAAHVVPHIEWPIPGGPSFSQGAIAGVPAKLDIDAEDTPTILVLRAYAHELVTRLGIGG